MEKKYLVLIYGQIKRNNFFRVYSNKEEAIERARSEYYMMKSLRELEPDNLEIPKAIRLIEVDAFESIDFLKEE